MKRKDAEGFYTRGFTTFLLLLSALTIAISGAVLYVTPRGRVANWTGWTMGGLEKEQWGSVHINAAILFVMIAALHIFFNWKVLLNYIRSRRTQGFRRKREFAAAVAVSALFVVGTLAEIQPFHLVIATHEDIKDYWEGTSARAPVAHAEDLRLDAFAQQIDMSVDAVVASLSSRGISVADREMKIGEIAREHGMTPSALYAVVRPAGGRRGNPGAGYTVGGQDYSEQDHTLGSGFGFGRMTLAEYCASQGMAVEASIARLKERGVQATGRSTMRDLAGALKVTPREVTRLVRK